MLLAPQGFGAMLAMPIAGQLSDRTGSGRIVPFGMVGIIAAVVWLTQIGAYTSYWATSVDLFIFGLGMGFTMMPVFSGAMQTMRKEAVARGSTSLNILQQTGASIGTAVLSVVLASALTAKLGAGDNGGIGAASHMTSSARAHVAPLMAAAFGQTFWWAVALLGAALASSLLLPKSKPQLARAESEPVPVAA